MKSLISIFIICLLQIANCTSGTSNIRYKTDRIEKEFKELRTENPELYQLVIQASNYSKEKFNKKLILTEVYRTQKEQDKYYKGKRKFKSPHQRWLAVDLRTAHYSTKQRKELVSYINDLYNNKNTYIPTAFYHNMGLGNHIHIQFKRRK